MFELDKLHQVGQDVSSGREPKGVSVIEGPTFEHASENPIEQPGSTLLPLGFEQRTRDWKVSHFALTEFVGFGDAVPQGT